MISASKEQKTLQKISPMDSASYVHSFPSSLLSQSTLKPLKSLSHQSNLKKKDSFQRKKNVKIIPEQIVSDPYRKEYRPKRRKRKEEDFLTTQQNILLNYQNNNTIAVEEETSPYMKFLQKTTSTEILTQTPPPPPLMNSINHQILCTLPSQIQTTSIKNVNITPIQSDPGIIKKRKKIEYVTDVEINAAHNIDKKSVGHLCHFLLLQLRAQCDKILNVKKEFDLKLTSLNSNMEDVLCCEPLMCKFFNGPGFGDKWVPWNTACGNHERYIVSKIFSLNHLNEKQKYLLHFAFRASSHPPFFDAVILPFFDQKESEYRSTSSSSTSTSATTLSSSSTSLKEEEVSLEDHFGIYLLNCPRQVFYKDSSMHHRFSEYRDINSQRRKLHTTCYRNHPPKGCGGDEFTWYMVERTCEFIEMGHAVFDVLCEVKSGKVNKKSLTEVLCSFKGIGPTMSKMFLVTTHLLYPEIGLLDDTCQVGDGASPALAILFGFGDRVIKPLHREILLLKLLNYLKGSLHIIEPRFYPMLEFTVEQTRAFLSPAVPKSSIPSTLTPFELQVNLCEWRKFLSIDTQRKICRNCTFRSLEMNNFSRKQLQDPPNSKSSSDVHRALTF